MRSAEIKIAKNPDMSEWDKQLLKLEAQNKEIRLRINLNRAKRVYMPADEYAVDKNMRSYANIIFDNVMNAPVEIMRTAPTATELTREHIKRFIDEVHATPAREPMYIGTRDGLDATLDAYRLWQTPTTTDTTIDWRREYTGTWEPMRNDAIVQIRLDE